MEDLIRLVEIVNKNKVKNIEVIGNATDERNTMHLLYDGIVAGRINDREGAKQLLFPDDSKSEQKAKRLEKRLFDRLINTLFFIDVNQPKFYDVQKAYYNSYRDFAAMKILMGRGDKLSAVKLGERILKKSLVFEFTDLSFNVLKELRVQYATVMADRNSYKRVSNLFNKQFEILRIELLAEEYYIDLARHFTMSNATKKEIAATATAYAIDLEPYLDQVDTQKFIMMAYSVLLMYHEINNDYEEVIKIATNAIERLSAKGKRSNKTYRYSFRLKHINAWIKLGDLSKSEQAIQEAIEEMEEGTINWYIVKDVYVRLLFHAKRYQDALELYNGVIRKGMLKKVPPFYSEQWKLYKAHLHYLLRVGKIKLAHPDNFAIPEFKLSKFLNEIPKYVKDKQGGNIQVLVLQLLFLIYQRKYDEIGQRLQAIESYLHRYLKKDSTYRTNCFIRMLQQLPKGYYNRKAVIRKSEKYVKKLSEMPLKAADQSAELEVIPYEDLWKMVLSCLKG